MLLKRSPDLKYSDITPRDAYLNRIRQAPAFIQFMGEMKAQNERYTREFR